MGESSFLARAASRFFARSRRSGENELLLTTPLGAQRIVLDQWRALKRLFLGPVLILCAPTLLQSLLWSARMGYGIGPAWAFLDALQLVMGLLNTVVGVGAVYWLAIWYGLKTSNQKKAILKAVALVEGVAFLIAVFGQLSLPLAVGLGLPMALRSALPRLAILVFYLRLIRWTKGRLLTMALRPQDP